MHILNRDGETVDLPESYTREQRNAALDLLGIPRNIGLRRTVIDKFDITVELYEFEGPAKRRWNGAAPVTLTVKIPMGDGAPKVGGAS